MSGPEVTGKHPIRAWRCAECGRISETEWVDGRHVVPDASDVSDEKQWCSGEAVAYYLLSQDEYLDVLLAAEDSP